MVRLCVGDDNGRVVLYAGCLPDVEHLKARRLKTAGYQNADVNSFSRDGLATWLLSASTRRLAAWRGHKGLEIPIESWLVLPPERNDAVLARWFDGQSQDYRLFIHREPRGYSICFGEAHDRIRIPHPTRKYAALKEPTKQFLKGVVRTYAEGDTPAVENLMRTTGHHYFFSRGLRQPEESLLKS